jgi:hypothetical protein
MGLLGRRFWGFAVSGFGMFLLAQALFGTYDGGNPEGSASIDRTMGAVILLAGILLEWSGFADERGAPGGRRAKMTAVVAGVGVAIGLAVWVIAAKVFEVT